MRCARCDRPIFPQAVGQTADGKVVYGWCVACMEATGCRGIVVARPSRGRSTKLVLTEREAVRSVGSVPTLVRPDLPRPRRVGLPADPRRRLVAVVALGLWLWGVTLITAGLFLRWLRGPSQPRTMGRGNPDVLVLGGATTVVIALFLVVTLFALAATPRPERLRSQWVGRLAQSVALLAMVGLLATALTPQNRQAAPFVALSLTVAVALAVALGTRRMSQRPQARTH
jgi:hypothetical protein